MTESCMESRLGGTSNFAARLMALAAAHIPDSAVGVEKCVTILAAPGQQLQHSEVSVNLVRGIGRESVAHATKVTAAGSRYDLHQASCRIGNAARCLRQKSLIMVLVPAEDEIHAAVVENSSYVLHFPRWSIKAGAEKWAVKVGERAERAMIVEISAQPIFLLPRLSGSALEVQLAVEGDRVPITDVIAVVAPSRRAGARTEVSEI